MTRLPSVAGCRTGRGGTGPEVRFRIRGAHGRARVEWRLRFQVLDTDGTVVAEEDIPYTIKRDGFFMYMDAI